MTTSFRVTESSLSTQVMANMQSALQKMQDLQDQLSSGKQIRKPSDDPAGAVEAMQYRSDAKRTAQYSRNADDGLGWLGMADNSMTSSLDTIRSVRDLVLQGANGTADASSRAALANEVAAAKQDLLGLANTTYNNRPIYSGTANPQGQTPPLSAYNNDGTYNGNTGAINRTVGANATVQVNFDGPSVWGQPGVSDLWHTLDGIENDLRSTDPTAVSKLTTGYTDPTTGQPVASDLDRLDANTQNIQNRLSEVGARYHRVQAMQTRADDNALTIQTNLSNVEDVDLPKTIMALQLQSVAYQSALSATAKVIQPSLIDFLK